MRVRWTQCTQSSLCKGGWNKRFLPLYGPVGQGRRKEELQVERSWVKMEKSTSVKAAPSTFPPFAIRRYWWRHLGSTLAKALRMEVPEPGMQYSLSMASGREGVSPWLQLPPENCSALAMPKSGVARAASPEEASQAKPRSCLWSGLKDHT